MSKLQSGSCVKFLPGESCSSPTNSAKKIRHHCGWTAVRHRILGFCPNCGGALAYDYEVLETDPSFSKQNCSGEED